MTSLLLRGVKISIGLRSAELECCALPGIMKVPMVFGFTFLDASFGNQLIGSSKADRQFESNPLFSRTVECFRKKEERR